MPFDQKMIKYELIIPKIYIIENIIENHWISLNIIENIYHWKLSLKRHNLFSIFLCVASKIRKCLEKKKLTGNLTTVIKLKTEKETIYFCKSSRYKENCYSTNFVIYSIWIFLVVFGECVGFLHFSVIILHNKWFIIV